MAEVTALALFKFGRLENLHKFRERGLLHMKKAAHYRSLENDGGVRSDPWEGFDLVGQPGRCKLIFKLPDGQVIEPELAGQVLINKGLTPVQHVYCMTALIEENVHVAQASGQKLLDPRLSEFGEHVAAVLNVSEFIRRTVQACKTQGFQYNYGAVEYLPEDHNGEIGPIMKNARYAWQSEFRLIVQGSRDEVLELEIGSLEDIVTIATTREVVDSVSYKSDDT